MNSSRISLTFTALLLGAVPALADKIYRTDGKIISGVTIEEENLTEVVYKEGRDQRTIASEAVLRVEYERMPRLVDEALGFLKEGDLASAIDNLDLYVNGQIENPNERRFEWAPAYAAWKACEIRRRVADLQGLEEAASRLIENYPNSRYLPEAYLAKASAELQMRDRAKAQKTLQKMSELVAASGLSKRWELECRLGEIVASDQSGDDKRKELGIVVTQAGTQYPTVKSRALVAEGETYLAEADAASDPSKAKTLRAEAKKVFEEIVADPRADDETLAGAYSGLGDCLFYLGAEAGDADLLREAAMHYLRVVTLYKGQSRYVPRALYYAGRCFDILKDPRRRNDMKRELAKLYPNSTWAAQAEEKL